MDNLHQSATLKLVARRNSSTQKPGEDLIHQCLSLFRRCFLTRFEVCILTAAIAVTLAGCESMGAYAVKTRGVYTTLQTTELSPGAGLDLPDSGNDQRTKFGPGEIPVALVRGYGGSEVALDLVELATGRSLFTKSIYIGKGKAGLQPLIISKSGDYKIRLLFNGVEHDSFKFAVTRDEPTENQNSAPISSIEFTLRINRGAGSAFAERARTYAVNGDTESAIKEYTEAIRLQPGNAAFRAARAKLLFARGDTDDSINDFTEAIRLDPNNVATYANRGYAYGGKGELDEAISDFSEAILRRPDYIKAYTYRASAYNQKGELENAIRDYDEAIRLKPDDAPTRYLRGYLFYKTGHYDKATVEFREAIRYDPRLGKAYNQLAWTLATCPAADVRNGQAAISAACSACEIGGWKDGHWIDTLAAAYAEAGDFESAIRYQNEALAAKGIDDDKRSKMLLRLAAYQRHEPWREPLK
jgi:Flp pilus assembly protein TadD